MPDLLGSWNTLTVRATLETTARLCRMDAASAAARANELIARMDAASAAAQPTRVLSRGQKQRLSLARTLVHDPVVLLLDEPASGLDPQARVDLRQLMRRVASEGKTVLISSHELAELDEMADGAVYLQDGVTASAESVFRTRSTARPRRIPAVDRATLESALLAAEVDPASINGDRDTGTLATSTGVAIDQNGRATSCTSGDTQITKVPRFDYFWEVLATNPYVLLATFLSTSTPTAL